MAEAAFLQELLKIQASDNAFAIARVRLRAFFLQPPADSYLPMLYTTTAMHSTAGLFMLASFAVKIYLGTFWFIRTVRRFWLPHHTIPWAIFAVISIISQFAVARC